MPPKAASDEIKIIALRTVGGEVPNSAALAPKVGPLGLNAKKIGDDIQKETSAYRGLRVTVRLIVQNRNAQIEVVPSAATLVVKALAEPPRDRKKDKNIKHNGNVTLDQVYDITRILRNKSMAKEFKGTVLEILGTAVSVGCKVENQDPRQVQKQIKDGSLVVPDQ